MRCLKEWNECSTQMQSSKNDMDKDEGNCSAQVSPCLGLEEYSRLLSPLQLSTASLLTTGNASRSRPNCCLSAVNCPGHQINNSTRLWPFCLASQALFHLHVMFTQKQRGERISEPCHLPSPVSKPCLSVQQNQTRSVIHVELNTCARV